MRKVYLDHAATTPLDPRVLEVMLPFLKGNFGNASSVHALGRRARFAVEESRDKVAALLGAEPGEIIFTSGGTESNNVALRGLLTGTRKHLLTSAAEHEAIVRPAERWHQQGNAVTLLKPERQGGVTPAQVAEALTPETGLVSLMHANNEVGTLTPLADIIPLCHEQDVPVHTDAVQTAGLFQLKVDELGVDLLSISGHKFYGPKGTGVLYVRGGIDFTPVIEGGAQERRRRGGTENVPGIVGLAKAMELAYMEAEERLPRISGLRDRLRRQLVDQLEIPFVTNTPVDEPGAAAPHILNLAFPPIDGRPLDGEMLILNLDMEGVMASAGSACTSGALEPSHVLQAMGLPRETASAVVRFSLGKDTTEEDIDFAAEKLQLILRRMTRGGRA